MLPVRCRCRSPPSFFGQAVCDLETLRSFQYFLLNYGHGYTGEFVGGMTFDEMNWHVGKLNDELKEKQQAKEKAARKASQQVRAARRRR